MAPLQGQAAIHELVRAPAVGGRVLNRAICCWPDAAVATVSSAGKVLRKNASQLPWPFSVTTHNTSRSVPCFGAQCSTIIWPDGTLEKSGEWGAETPKYRWRLRGVFGYVVAFNCNVCRGSLLLLWQLHVPASSALAAGLTQLLQPGCLPRLPLLRSRRRFNAAVELCASGHADCFGFLCVKLRPSPMSGRGAAAFVKQTCFEPLTNLTHAALQHCLQSWRPETECS